MTMDCVICLHPTKDELVLACNHRFCTACIMPWLEVNNKCPVCSKMVGDSPRNVLEDNTEEQQSPPCIDHLYPQRSNLQMKLLHLNTRIQTKTGASVKACFSKAALNDLKNRQLELEELFDLFSLLVDQGGSISEAVALMETINFGMLQMEELLQGRSTSFVDSPEECMYDEYLPSQYEDDFPEMEVRQQPKSSKKRTDKSKFTQGKKCVK